MSDSQVLQVTVVLRERTLGVYLALLGTLTFWAAVSMWTGPLYWFFASAGLWAFCAGAWWALSTAPAIVWWFPWEAGPTLYCWEDPEAATGAVDYDTRRMLVLAWTWAELGWWDGVRALATPAGRWLLLVHVCAAYADQQLSGRNTSLHDRNEITRRETRWLADTATAVVMNKGYHDCGVAIGEMMRASK